MAESKKETQKITYEIDPYNRLIIDKSGRKSKLSRFRQVLDGRFKTDKSNNLTYHIKTPNPKGTETPHQLKLEGKWSLNKEHNLCLTLNKWERETLGDKLTLKGEIIDVSKNSIAFSVTTRTQDNMESICILQLKGTWQADKHNRLTFMVQKEEGSDDVLTFKGTWAIGKNHQIIYKYEKSDLITKKKEVQALKFKGHWDIKDKARISYLLGAGTDSVFDFKAGAGLFRDKYIKYEIGVGIGKSSSKQTVTLSGEWKVKKDIGLTFEIEYEDKEIQEIIFGAKAKLNKRDSISFELKDEKGENPVGKIELSRKILKGDGLSFLRFLKSKEESVIMVGAGFRW